MTSAGPSKLGQGPTKRLQAATTQSVISSEIIETYIIIPPDGGWGWLVAVTSFITNFTADGTMYTFGLFTKEICSATGSSRTQVELANSIMTGVYYLSGPIISALTNRFGFRGVAIVGGLLSSAAIFITSYTSSLFTVLFVYAAMGGLGFGMMYVPSIIVIGFYFERWRALATSIAVCGSSLGIVTFPIVFQRILKDMEWRAKFYVLSVMCLISSFCAILYRPLEPKRIVSPGDGRTSLLESSILTDTGAVLNRYNNRGYPTAADLHGVSAVSSSAPTRSSSMSVLMNTTTPTNTTNSFGKPMVKLETLYENSEDGQENVKHKCKKCSITFATCFCCYCRRQRNRLPVRPLYRDDIFYRGSLSTLSEYSYILSSYNSSTRIPFDGSESLDYHLSVTRVTTAKDVEEENQQCICCPLSVKRTLATMLDMSLLKSPSFVLLSVSGCFTTLGLYSPFMFIVKRAEEHGYDNATAALLLSTLGFSNALGRIACGIVSSISNVNALVSSYVTLTICGLATIVSSFSYNNVWQFGCASVIGFTLASMAALRSVIIAEMVGLDKLTNGFGLCLLFQGFTCLAGVPISSILRDVTGTNAAAFYFSGSSILFSGILLMPLAAVLKWEKEKQITRR